MGARAMHENPAHLTAMVRGHLEKTLQIKVKLKARAVVLENLAACGLANVYSAVVMEVAGRDLAFLLALEPVTPAQVARDVHLFGRRARIPVVLATPSMTSTERAQYAEKAISFVVPGKQIFLLHHFTDLRENFGTPVRVRNGLVSPVAQVALFASAYSGAPERTPSELTDKTGYTLMSLVRAFDELNAHGIASVKKRGREKILSLKTSPRETIAANSELLSKPYRGVYGVRFSCGKPKLLKAGETALAAWTGSASEDLPTFAIPSPGWREFFETNGIERCSDLEGADAIIETWRYDPAILARRGLVDPLSLYAQYWDDPNPRLAKAAEALLQELPE